MTTREDFAWAAGLFEGEGCIGNGNQAGYVRLQLCTTDRDVIERFAEIVAIGSIGPGVVKSKLGRKPIYGWNASGDKAEALLVSLVPYLGARRYARAQEVLAFRANLIADATQPRICPGCERVFTPVWSNSSRRQEYCEAACRDHHNTRVRTVKRDTARAKAGGRRFYNAGRVSN